MRRAEEAVPAPALVRSAEEVVVRDTGGVNPPEESGDEVRVASLLATRGEDVRPMTGGVAVRDGGGVGRLMAGLSQEEKKSSSASLGVEASSPPSMITSGFLWEVSWVEGKQRRRRRRGRVTVLRHRRSSS